MVRCPDRKSAAHGRCRDGGIPGARPRATGWRDPADATGPPRDIRRAPRLRPVGSQPVPDDQRAQDGAVAHGAGSGAHGRPPHRGIRRHLHDWWAARRRPDVRSTRQNSSGRCRAGRRHVASAFLSRWRLVANPCKPPPGGRQVQKECEPADRSDTDSGAGHGIGEIVPSQADDADSDDASQHARCARDQHPQRPCLQPAAAG